MFGSLGKMDRLVNNSNYRVTFVTKTLECIASGIKYIPPHRYITNIPVNVLLGPIMKDLKDRYIAIRFWYDIPGNCVQ